MLKLDTDSKGENFQPYLSTKNRIFIVGPLKLQNSLLATFLKQGTGLECLIFTNFQAVREKAKDQSLAALFLYDCLGNDFEPHFSEMFLKQKVFFLNNYLALFNVLPGAKIKEKELRSIVKGYFYSNESLELFTEGILTIFKGDLWLSEKALSEICPTKRMVNPVQKRVSKMLTDREMEILNLISNGEPNFSVAETLQISNNTVQNHLSNIYKKLNVSNRFQAAMWGLANL